MIVLSIMFALIAAACGAALLRIRNRWNARYTIDRPGSDEQWGQWLNDESAADAAERGGHD